MGYYKDQMLGHVERGCTPAQAARRIALDDRVADARLARLREAAARDASLGCGHVWTAVSCPAYRTYDPADCTCTT